jgi:Tfp pilus assembly protein PilF
MGWRLRRLTLLRFCALLAGVAACASALDDWGKDINGRPPRNIGNGLTTAKGEHAGVIRGQVTMADGSALPSPAQIEPVCAGASSIVIFADAGGRFSFLPAASLEGCALVARVECCRSEQKVLNGLRKGAETDIGRIVVEAISSNPRGLAGASSKRGHGSLDHGLEEAAHARFKGAMDALRKATAEAPEFSQAWLTLGMVQKATGDVAGARESFLKAASADANFAAPLIQLAALDVATQDWRSAAAYADKAIEINPSAFPHAYALSALANANLQNGDVALKSAQEGLRLDAAHNYPQLEYYMGMLLASRNDAAGAATHLQAYLELAPKGSDAESARNAITKMQASGQHVGQ